MGWTSTDLYGKSVTEYFKNSFGNSAVILDSAVVNRKEYYSAVYFPDTNEIVMVCALLQFSRGAYNFSYKDMTEHSGPYIFNCPKNIFKALTPLKDNNEFAKQWRARQLQKYCIPSIHTGDIVIIKDDEMDVHTVYECTNAKRNYYYDMIQHKSWRITRIKEMPIFTILNVKGEEKSMLTLEEFYRDDKFIPFTNLYMLFDGLSLADILEKIERYNQVKTSARGVLGGVYQIKNKDDYVCCVDVGIEYGKKSYIFVELLPEDISMIKKQHIKNSLVKNN